MKTRRAFIVAYMLIGILSGLLTAGWAFARSQGEHPALAEKNLRIYSAAGVCVGLLTVTIWPVAVPECYLLLDYAEHGWRAPWDLHKGGNRG